MDSSPESPEEVASMAKYLGVNLDQGEYHLLAIAREAVIAPVLSPWQEMADENGNPYFYNHRTKESTRRHPLDLKFLQLVHEKRSSRAAGDSTRTWMRFKRGTEIGELYFYNFKDGSSQVAVEKELEILDLPAEECPTYDAEPPPLVEEIQEAVVQKKPQEKRRVWRPQVKHDFSVTHLTFKSWWQEDKEEADRGNNMVAGGGLKKRYLTLKFDVFEQTFQVDMNNEEAISLYNLSSLTAKGDPIECWDLHVGAKMNLLGKQTTLMQADLPTTNWLEYHRNRLQTVKDGLEKALRKYDMRHLTTAVTFQKGSSVKGGTSLRALMEQIDKLREMLAKYRPELAAKFAKKASPDP
eukprot:gene16256-19291_t